MLLQERQIRSSLAAYLRCQLSVGLHHRVGSLIVLADGMAGRSAIGLVPQ